MSPRADQEQLVSRLVEFSVRSGITQENLAHEIGVTFATVNAWFNGHKHKMHKATEKAVLLFLKKQEQRES